ncbi:MAG: ComEC/Rec2 family competence protein [Candidatus Omnitrophica bacterium]|nr:ComEC/Rec2 family competence protein [Candidatus Omnitrophota bacterium]
MSDSFSRNPLFACALFFAGGICCAGALRARFFYACIPAVFFLTLAFLLLHRRHYFAVCILLVFFLLGCCFLSCALALPRHHIRNLPYAFRGDSPAVLKCRVISTPFMRGGKQAFLAQADFIEYRGSMRPCCGKMLIFANNHLPLLTGESLLCKGRLQRPFGYRRMGHGAPGKKRYASGAIAGVMRGAVIFKSGNAHPGVPAAFMRHVFFLRERLKERLGRHTSDVCAAVLSAMILGERSRLPQAINNMMIRTGTVHILVVSGFNVGIVCFLCMLALKILRIPRSLRTAAGCVLIVGYCLITGASSPVVRATVMAVVFLCSRLLTREADIYNACALAALAMLAVDPQELFDIGFQLSFASVLAIIWLYPRLRALIARFLPALPPLRYVTDMLLVSLAAWLGTAGLVAYHFGFFTPVAVAANLLVVPLASVITLAGFGLMISESFFPQLAVVFAPALELLVHLMLRVNAFFIRIPGAYIRLGNA